MELDSRIIEGKTYLDCFDTKIAKQFKGKKCYFARELSRFRNLDGPGVYKATLTDISEGYEVCYGSEELGIQQWDYARYIIPCEWVKEPETVLRPLTNEEFLDLFDAGKLRSVRTTGTRGRYIITDVYFSDSCGKEEVYVCFDCGDCGYEMEYLLKNNFEYLDGDEWKPFGIEINK